MTDWAAWHAPYDHPDSPLSQRLQLQQAQDPNLRNKNVAVLSTLTLRTTVGVER